MMKSKDEIYDEIEGLNLILKPSRNSDVTDYRDYKTRLLEVQKIMVLVDIRDVLESIQNELVNIQNLQFLSKEQKAMRRKYMKKLYEDNKYD
jgi:hypothetical protein